MMRIRKQWIAALAGVWLFQVGLAAAQERAGETHWMCWYNNDTTVRCVLELPAPDGDLAERQVKIANPAPGATPLPPGVRRIIRASAELLGVEILVPLFSEPAELIFVEQLANFTMCYGKPLCRVTFVAQAVEVALLQ